MPLFPVSGSGSARSVQLCCGQAISPCIWGHRPALQEQGQPPLSLDTAGGRCQSHDTMPHKLCNEHVAGFTDVLYIYIPPVGNH
jgi:hypothetical protein